MRNDIRRKQICRGKLLDIDTGGGEFLLSLHHPYKNTSAAEAYPPNVELCKQTLLPLGIDFRAGDGKDTLPFDDAAFDIVINRHGDFNVQDIHRILKDGAVEGRIHRFLLACVKSKH